MEHASLRELALTTVPESPRPSAGLSSSRCITTQELAALLNVTPEVLRTARTYGTGVFANLRWHKLGRIVRYRPRDVADWLAAHERGHAA